MTRSIGRKISLGYALILGVLALTSLNAYWNASTLNETVHWEAHTYEVIAALEDTLAQLQNVEAGARGLALTGDESFLARYRDGVPGAERALNRLRSLTADNPNQQRNLEALELVVRRNLEARRALVEEMRRTHPPPDAVAAAEAEIKGSMDEARRRVTEMIDLEQKLLSLRIEDGDRAYRASVISPVVSGASGLLLLLIVGWMVTRSITRPVQELVIGAEKIGAGELEHRITVRGKDELAVLGRTFNQMAARLWGAQQVASQQDWLKSNVNVFAGLLQGQRDATSLVEGVLGQLAQILSFQHGAVYVVEGNAHTRKLRLSASYARTPRAQAPVEFGLGEGLVGQCAADLRRRVLHHVPGDYIRLSSGLGETNPVEIVLVPAAFEGSAKAVLELAALHPFSEIQLGLLDKVSESMGITLHAIEAASRTEDLLRESQAQTEELRVQQEELSQTNNLLQASEEELRQQQEQLRAINVQLAEKAHLLEEQKQGLELARAQMQQKAEEVALASKFKSDFLANVSHELRTPLNSILILSQILGENTDGKLSPKQVEYAGTIHSAGSDLLALINDILDLAKIEAGSTTLEVSSVSPAEVRMFCEQTFRPVAEQKQLEFAVDVAAGVSPNIETDVRRLQQILKNLLANAFKFTQKGRVSLTIRAASGGGPGSGDAAAFAGRVEFLVEDTGIGIPLDKRQTVFEAFRQADTSTSRKYGGTGLGLSISRELAGLLGGELHLLRSTPAGSAFVLTLPERPPTERARVAESTRPSGSPPANASRSTKPPPASGATSADSMSIPDDRDALEAGVPTLLIVQSDAELAGRILRLARTEGFKGVVTGSAEGALKAIRRYEINALSLALNLPDRDGWSVLDQLKHDPATRHLPVQLSSDRLDTSESNMDEQRGLREGALLVLTQPASDEIIGESLRRIKAFLERPTKRLLVVEDNEAQQKSIAALLGNGDIKTTLVASGGEALAALAREPFDCVVLDLGLPDMSGAELLERMREELGLKQLPVVVYTARTLTEHEETELRRAAKAIVVKSVASAERLLDETALFLHRVEANLPEPRRRVIEHVRKTDHLLRGRKVLIVDDDVRNIFALTAILEKHGMQIAHAENGRNGIALLQSTAGIEAVLMDMMMPEMDGYETMRAIRGLNGFSKLPIIALTAKAMAGDRRKCIDAGASDYISKPVEPEQLLSLLRVWLYR